MKHLRLWLLVVLAALLPLRGAMAAAMMCPPALAAGQGEARMANALAGDDHHGADAEAHVHHGQHGHHEVAPGAGHAGGHDKCTMCAAFCSITPIPSTVPGLPELGPPGTATFPDLHAPAPTFLSDGQERPPRSI